MIITGYHSVIEKNAATPLFVSFIHLRSGGI